MSWSNRDEMRENYGDMKPSSYRAHECDVVECRSAPQWMILVRNDRAVPKYGIGFACDEHRGDRVARLVESRERDIVGVVPRTHIRLVKARPDQEWTYEEARSLAP